MADFSVEPYIQVGLSDNAERAQDNEIEEVQSRAGLTLDGQQEGANLEIYADISVDQYFYEKKSQEDQSRVQGDIGINLHNARKSIGLALSSDRRIVIKDQSSAELIENTDERQINSIEPFLNARLSSVDNLRFSAILSDTFYVDGSGLDSIRQGGSITWTRLSSSVDQWSLFLQGLDVRFEELDSFNYQYASLMVNKQAKLRNITYQLGLGFNGTESDISDIDLSPSYNFDLTYTNGQTSSQFIYKRFVTDSSTSGNNESDIGDIGLGDVSRSELDRIDREDFLLSFVSPLANDRWNVSFRAQGLIEDFKNLPNDNTSQEYRLGIEYLLGAKSSIEVDYKKRKLEYDTTSLGRSYEEDKYSVSYKYKFSKRFNSRFYLEGVDRLGESINNTYIENRIWLNLTYKY